MVLKSPVNPKAYGLAALAATTLCVSLAAYAVEGPHSTFVDDPESEPPRNAVCLGDDCPVTDEIWSATQSYDCNYAGLGTPSLDTAIPHYGATTDDLLQQQSDPFEYMFFPQENFGVTAWPDAAGSFASVGADQGPFKGFAMKGREGRDIVSPGNVNVGMQSGSFGSINFQTPATGVMPEMQRFVNQQVNIGGESYTSLLFDDYNRGLVTYLAISAQITFEPNGCRVRRACREPRRRRCPGHGPAH